MRMKLIPNPTFDPHDEASAQRDNINTKKSTTKPQIFNMQISKEALQTDDANDEGLTEEDLKVGFKYFLPPLFDRPMHVDNLMVGPRGL
jgi:hypothetical protein